jgi:hypothetical protein
MVKTGTKVQHVSNNAPFSLADFGSSEADARRKAGVAMAKRWIEGSAVLGPVSMRMNSPQALGPSIRPNAIPRSGDGYPRNLEIVPLMNAAIESYKEMADFGGKYGVKVTFENHWGLAADPMNIRHHDRRGQPPVLRRDPRLRQLGARTHALQRTEGTRAVHELERPREVLGPVGRRQRRAAVGAHHDGSRLQGHLRAWSTNPGL